MLPTYLPYADFNLIRAYEWQAIERAFNSVSRDWEISFDFPQGGCQQRAQIMSMILEKKFNITHCKIWLFAPAALVLDDSRMLFSKDSRTLSPGNIMEWSYHVAPAVRVLQGNRIDTYVIDPAINSKMPLPVKHWFEAIGNSSSGKYCYLLPDKYFFNSSYHDAGNNGLTMLFDGSFYNYENPAKDNLAVEKGLAINDMVMKIFDAFIAPLIKNYQPENSIMLEDLKSIFGNATALDMLFSQNISGYTENTTHRYVITHYTDIINEAKSIFNERLVYWTTVINELL